AVAQVALVAGDLDRQVGRQALVADGHQVGLVLAVVVADEHGRDRRSEVLGDPVEDGGERRRGVVRDDEDPDSLGGRRGGHRFSAGRWGEATARLRSAAWSPRRRRWLAAQAGSPAGPPAPSPRAGSTCRPWTGAAPSRRWACWSPTSPC